MPKLLTTAQVAAVCGLSERQFYWLIADGLGEAARPVVAEARLRL